MSRDASIVSRKGVSGLFLFEIMRLIRPISDGKRLGRDNHTADAYVRNNSSN